MNKQELRDELMHQLWRMNKMDLIVSLQEFIEGETATLSFLGSCAGRQVTPSQISDNLHISRARTANILRSLRRKKFVEMCILEDDRRKMCVSLTEAGKAFLEEKRRFLIEYFDLYVEVLGEQDIKELTRLLEKTADSERLLKENNQIPGRKP